MIRPCARLSLAILMTVLPSAALGVDNYSLSDVTPDFAGGTGPSDMTHTGTGPQDTSASATGGASSSGSAISHVDYGHVHLRGVGASSINTLSRGYIRDMVTINAPGIAHGTVGTFTYAVTISGALESGSGASGAGYTLKCAVGTGSTFGINRSANQYSPHLGGAFSGDPFSTYSGPATFQFGVPFELQVQYEGSGDAAINNGPGDSLYVLSLTWAGISGIKAGGAGVSGATSTSDSGTDWLGPASPPPADCPDVNQDGVVNTVDLGAVLGYFGNSVASVPAADRVDFNHDGVVNTVDLGILLGRFGQSCP